MVKGGLCEEMKGFIVKVEGLEIGKYIFFLDIEEIRCGRI